MLGPSQVVMCTPLVVPAACPCDHHRRCDARYCSSRLDLLTSQLQLGRHDQRCVLATTYWRATKGTTLCRHKIAGCTSHLVQEIESLHVHCVLSTSSQHATDPLGARHYRRPVCRSDNSVCLGERSGLGPLHCTIALRRLVSTA